MTSREMLITFEELLRTTNPELEFDTNINTDVIYTFLTRAEQEYITQNFLSGDSIVDNINAIRKRSDVLRKLIKRTGINAITSANQQLDGGYEATFTETDYWLFLSGILKHAGLIATNRGADNDVVELDLINHYDLQKKVRTINNEPVLKMIPVVLEGNDKFVFYLDTEKEDQIGGVDIANITFEIIYLAFPPAITSSAGPSLAVSTHNDIVKLAVQTYVREYKYLLGQAKPNQNG